MNFSWIKTLGIRAISIGHIQNLSSMSSEETPPGEVALGDGRDGRQELGEQWRHQALRGQGHSVHV